MSAGRQLRERLDRGSLLLPGAADPLTARILEDVGFEAVYATGAGIANVAFALPDVGMLGMTEVIDHVGRISSAVSTPLLADADTGYGGPLNVARTVREMERAGVAGLQIEDQVSPKRCGHFTGTEVVDEAEMLGRIRAALRARQDPSTVMVGRTDATVPLGLDTAIRRGRLLAEAGADLVFVEVPSTVEDLARIPVEVPAPTLVNVVEGGRTPQLSFDEYVGMGFAVVLYANTAMRLSAHAVRAGSAELLAKGDSRHLFDRMLSWDDRQRLVRRDEHDILAAWLQAADSQCEPTRPADDQEAETT